MEQLHLSSALPQPSLNYAGEGRGLMNNGNYSVTFMPLIAVMATMVPRFLSRIKQMRPTQTVSGRDVRLGRAYMKEVIDSALCSDVRSGDHYRAFPEYPQLFYRCSPNHFHQHCTHKAKRAVGRQDPYKNYFLGRLSGKNGCVHLKLYHCPSQGQLLPRPCQRPYPDPSHLPPRQDTSHLPLQQDISHLSPQHYTSHLPPFHDPSHLSPQQDTSHLPPYHDPSHLSPQQDTSHLPPYHDPSHLSPQHDPSHLPPNHDPSHLSPQQDTSHLPSNHEPSHMSQQQDTSHLPPYHDPSYLSPQHTTSHLSPQHTTSHLSTQQYTSHLSPYQDPSHLSYQHDTSHLSPRQEQSHLFSRHDPSPPSHISLHHQLKYNSSSLSLLEV